MKKVALLVSCMLGLCAVDVAGPGGIQNPVFVSNASGQLGVYSSTGFIDTTNPFFQSLGTNGRTCASCHVIQEAMSIAPPGIQARFQASHGLDPLFHPFDGTNCPTDDVSTLAARRSASSLLLSKGLIRIGMEIPEHAEFKLEVEKDPYGCAIVGSEVSVYRRPLPSTNIVFLSAVMWDGRESPAGKSIRDGLLTQALNATMGHARASQPPSAHQLDQIVQFQEKLFTAQAKDILAGPLDSVGATGGPEYLSQQEFFIGINDPLGFNPTGAPFDPEAFTMFKPWKDLAIGSDRYLEPRRAISRGLEIFNTKPIAITGVAGINDFVGAKTVMGFCTTCHDSPNVGNHSVAQPLDIGIGDASPLVPLDARGLPVFKLTRLNGPRKVIYTTDPGRALVSGKWADVGKMKGPILRGLAPRGPYFHNGSAATLEDVINFYNRRFKIGLTPQEKSDLLAALLAF